MRATRPKAARLLWQRRKASSSSVNDPMKCSSWNTARQHPSSSPTSSQRGVVAISGVALRFGYGSGWDNRL
eukprot:3767889-Rhodomonas_salina.2